MDSNLNMSEIRKILNWIDGKISQPPTSNWIDKYNPHTGKVMSTFVDSKAEDVSRAVAVAEQRLLDWSQTPAVHRGQILFDIAALMERKSDQLAACIAEETGKPPQDAVGEVGAAIMQAKFFAGEGMRLYGRSLTSSTPGKFSHTVRQPRGVTGLIVPANTPIANIAWKCFPALICGNTVVLKSSEDAPAIASLFAEITKEAGLPDGVLNVVHGTGPEAGSALVEDTRVALISFTGSTQVGKAIGEVCGRRLGRVSLELGGKNALVVCDDADIDKAVHWASLSAFSNAGQRCAAASRVLVFEQVYDTFLEKLIAKAEGLNLGVGKDSDLGPVVSEKQRQSILDDISNAIAEGGKVECGGVAATSAGLEHGYYVLPTVISGLGAESDLCSKEVFGPVVSVHRIRDLPSALSIANNTKFGLTASIHTRNVDRAMWFAQRVRTGVANINFGTYGSEPHMPFGGFGLSGNGTREPGVEALDVYSELKNISFLTREDLL